MTTALVFAGGTGIRMNEHAKVKPKQFLELHGKPIIIHTLEHFEMHPKIDNIVVVCLSEWIQRFKQMIKRYSFEKINHIVPGGDKGYISIYNGLEVMSNKCLSEDIVLIHDGVRPLINSSLISTNIDKVTTHNAVITVEAVAESIVKLNNVEQIIDMPPRAQMYIAKAPQTFKFGLIWDLYKRAFAEGITFIDSSHLCSIYGIQMHTVKSTPYNIKITTPSDYYVYRALFEASEIQQILGL
jgi:2-C-methyl-D-erythritol 4-phosphate cytidylyltransferase